MTYTQTQRANIFALLLLLLVSLDSHAHEYSNLNEVMIDRANDSIANSVVQVQSFLTDIFRRTYVPDEWPDRKLSILRNDLMHQKEEANMSLDYFAANGVNVQTQDILWDNPLAGRSMAANQAVETAFSFLKYITALENQDIFITEIYSGGQSAHMYNLLTSYREKMSLYKAIFDNVPGPDQIIDSLTEDAAVTEADETSTVPYLVGILLFGIVVVGLVLKKQSIL
ncbi:MAG: hypothetical protein HKN08_00035 [Gammaproteobacteria bacterium]|nr:hypothetical protein [Gammaproteobacteria bacterium]